MPITYQWNCEGYDVHVVFEGAIRPEDVMNHFNTFMNKADLMPDAKALIELRATSYTGFSLPEIRKLASLTSQFDKLVRDTKTAVVATRPLAYGLARMYISVRNPSYSFRIFRTLEEGLAWLKSA